MTAQKPKILLVEDEQAHADLIMIAMEQHELGNDVIHVKDGEEALNFLLRKGEYSKQGCEDMPNLILLDLRLPRVDGLEVLTRIKSDEKLKKIPVVILTTSASEKDLLKAYENNVNSYLVKPVDYKKFRKMLETLGYYWLGYNRKPY